MNRCMCVGVCKYVQGYVYVCVYNETERGCSRELMEMNNGKWKRNNRKKKGKKVPLIFLIHTAVQISASDLTMVIRLSTLNSLSSRTLLLILRGGKVGQIYVEL